METFVTVRDGLSLSQGKKKKNIPASEKDTIPKKSQTVRPILLHIAKYIFTVWEEGVN